MIVVDASVIVTALADDGPDGDKARLRLPGQRLTAPQVIDLEVISAWRRMAAAGDIDERRADLAFADLQALRLDRVRPSTAPPALLGAARQSDGLRRGRRGTRRASGNNPSHGRRQALECTGHSL